MHYYIFFVVILCFGKLWLPRVQAEIVMVSCCHTMCHIPWLCGASWLQSTPLRKRRFPLLRDIHANFLVDATRPVRQELYVSRGFSPMPIFTYVSISMCQDKCSELDCKKYRINMVYSYLGKHVCVPRSFVHFIHSFRSEVWNLVRELESAMSHFGGWHQWMVLNIFLDIQAGHDCESYHVIFQTMFFALHIFALHCTNQFHTISCNFGCFHCCRGLLPSTTHQVFARVRGPQRGQCCISTSGFDSGVWGHEVKDVWSYVCLVAICIVLQCYFLHEVFLGIFWGKEKLSLQRGICAADHEDSQLRWRTCLQAETKSSIALCFKFF